MAIISIFITLHFLLHLLYMMQYFVISHFYLSVIEGIVTLLFIFCQLKILEGRSYKLQFPWIGVVNRSQADINKNVDMIAARRREREYFSESPEYKHLASKMGSEHLGKVLSKVRKI